MGSVLVIVLQAKLLNDYNYKIREKNNIFEPHSSRKVVKKKKFKKNKYHILTDDDD